MANGLRVTYRFGPFRLDTSTRVLDHKGVSVAVEPQVFEVLAHLAANPGRVVAKDELLQAVWGDVFVSEAALSSRIMAARRALGDSGKEQNWIRTVHGRGFRFLPEVVVEDGFPTALDERAQEILAQARQLLETGKIADAEARLAEVESELSAAPADADRAWAELRLLEAQCLLAREGWGSAEAAFRFEEAIRLAEGVGAVDLFRTARYHLATLHELRAEFAASETLMRAAVLDSAEAGDPEALELLACSLFHQGRFAESSEQALRGLEASTTQQPRLSAYYGEDPTVSCHHWRALSLWLLGEEDEAMRHASRALRLSEQPGRLFCLAQSRQQAAMLHQLRRDLALCEHWAKATVAIGERQSLAYRTSAGHILRIWARTLAGRLPQEIEAMRQYLEALLATGAEMEAPYFEALVAEAELAAGQAEEAFRRLSPTQSFHKDRGYFYEAERLRTRALAARQIGQEANSALAILDEALKIAESQRAVPITARIRADIERIS